jgi:hypothetical protein
MNSLDWTETLDWISRSRRVLIKKLSRNDCSWADDPKTYHQYGPYVPAEIRASGFFPELTADNPEKPLIYHATLNTLWPATGELKKSHLRHFSKKGPEMHFTRVPRGAFAALTPASLLVGGILKAQTSGAWHWFTTIDSDSAEAELLESMFDLSAEFHYGLFDPVGALKVREDETSRLIDDLCSALKAGRLAEFIESVSRLPDPADLAAAAQSEYLKQSGMESLDPFSIAKPGDAIMKISRDIEYTLYKRAERRHRAGEVLGILLKHGGDKGSSGLAESIVRGFAELDGAFLSASQHRKSRAGRSFEQHISRMLTDGGIPFEEQAPRGARRPDFVLPSLAVLKSKKRDFLEALILSAKTTLRERWKQLVVEKTNCELFLATVDDRVSADAIDDMKDHGIRLVVPESLKTANETCYEKKSNVITFRDFFDTEISARRRHYWRA